MNNPSHRVRVYHESLGERPVEMELSFSLNQINLNSEDPQLTTEWAVENLKIDKGGANNQLFLLTHPAKQGWVIYVREYSVIQDLKKRFPYKKIPRKNFLSTGLSLTLAPLLIILGLLIAGYLFRGTALDYIVDSVPTKYEKKVGEVTLKQLVPLSDLKKYAKSSDKLTLLMKPIFDQVKAKGYDFKVFIINRNEVNAFALPGGFLVFNRGLLTKAESPEEILGVAAHEVAHVVKRHSLRQLISTIGTYGVVQLLIGDVSGIIAVVADNSTFLLSRMYSRDSEAEADSEGLKYLNNAKIDPRGLVSFFKKLKIKQIEKVKQEKEVLKDVGLEEESLNNFDLSFLSTHPNIDERILDIEKKIKARGLDQIKYKKSQFDLEAFQKELSDLDTTKLNKDEK